MRIIYDSQAASISESDLRDAEEWIQRNSTYTSADQKVYHFDEVRIN
jgi:hypothetical protein